MTRNKVNLEFISNNTVRKTTFKKRCRGFLKKIEEVSTLCEAESCVIIYNENDPEPIVAPSVNEARRTIQRFRSLPEHEQSKRMVDQESFSTQRLEKMQEKLNKQRRENRDKEITQKMFESMSMNPMDVSSNLDPNECDEIAKMFNRHIIEMEVIMEKLETRTSTSSNLPPPI